MKIYNKLFILSVSALIFLFISCDMIGCTTTAKKERQQWVIDTIAQELSHIKDTTVHDTVYLEDERWKDSFIAVSMERDVLKYKLERVRYYNDLIGTNPSLRIYIRGWLNRVLEE